MAAINAAMAQIQTSVTPGVSAAAIGGGVGAPTSPGVYGSYGKAPAGYENVAPYGYQGFQHGGIIPEPTLLYGLRSMRPYAIAGEAGPERVSPMGSADIRIYLDGRVIAEKIGAPLVDIIRVKTGVRI